MDINGNVIGLSYSGKKVSDIFGGKQITGGSSAIKGTQNIHKSSDGRFVVWDPVKNDYIDITNDYLKKVGNNVKNNAGKYNIYGF